MQFFLILAFLVLKATYSAMLANTRILYYINRTLKYFAITRKCTVPTITGLSVQALLLSVTFNQQNSILLRLQSFQSFIILDSHQSSHIVTSSLSNTNQKSHPTQFMIVSNSLCMVVSKTMSNIVSLSYVCKLLIVFHDFSYSCSNLIV